MTLPVSDPLHARFAATLTDEQLASVVDAIRGSSKRGRRIRLTPAETLALAAVYGEQRRRGIGVVGTGQEQQP